MATKRRAQPKKRRNAKHRPARVAVRRADGPPTAGPAVFKREPPIIADTATSSPPGPTRCASHFRDETCLLPAEHAGDNHVGTSRRWITGDRADYVPREAFTEPEFEPLGVVELARRPSRLLWLAVVLLVAILLVLAFSVPARAADLTLNWIPQPGATATRVFLGPTASTLAATAVPVASSSYTYRAIPAGTYLTKVEQDFAIGTSISNLQQQQVTDVPPLALPPPMSLTVTQPVQDVFGATAKKDGFTIGAKVGTTQGGKLCDERVSIYGFTLIPQAAVTYLPGAIKPSINLTLCAKVGP